MRKKLALVFLAVFIATLGIACDPNQALSLDGGSNSQTLTQEEEYLAVGVSSFIYVALAEITYMLEEGEVDGMSGTIGDSESDLNITFNNCDLGLLFDETASPGELIIESGTHHVYKEGTTLFNTMDIRIAFNVDDELNGTYRVIYESRTLNHEDIDSEEEVLIFTVNGTTLDMELFEELYEEEG